MQGFEFFSPTKIIFGAQTETQVGTQVAAFGGSRVLVLYGGESAKKSGLLGRVTASLEDAGLTYQVLGGIRPNPRLDFARECVQKALDFGADFLLAVGGGSVIDTAKAVANGAANPEVDIWALWKKEVPLTRALPVACVLTIPAAGSESSDSAVLTNNDTQEKRGLSSPLQRPKFAIMNPELAFTLPPYQVGCGIVDILMHTLDRYFNPVTTNELTDALAEALVRTVLDAGRRTLANPGEYQAMSELMWAGSLSHNTLTGLGGRPDFAPHQLGHELSAMFDAAHGATLSAIWDSWARYCIDADAARFARFGVNVWGIDPAGKSDRDVALLAIDATAAYFSSISMPTCLTELGCGVLPQETLEELARRCTFFGKRTIGTFKVLGYDDILSIYQMANR